MITITITKRQEVVKLFEDKNQFAYAHFETVAIWFLFIPIFKYRKQL